ncbi:MAG: 23S rRNA (adenine(2503)-C(2))-methyltransferase RlmN [Thermodesulfobacteriota bacterium]
MTDLLNLTLPELESWLAGLGEPRFRAAQLFQWLWRKGAAEFEAMTNLSKALRGKLAETAAIVWPQVADTRVSSDGTVKLLLRLADGALVETVLIPEEDHLTQCLSSQVGCPMACAFCSTGAGGFTRNMTAGEMAAQILVARRRLKDQGRDPKDLRNLVFMGMGEPLLNLAELLRALAVITHDQGLGFSTRRATVSTCGLPGPMRQLGASGLASLAVSLHAPTQELRARLMPRAAAAAPLDELMPALRDYPLTPRQRITIEYVLLAGVNDAPEHARQLVRLLSGLKCKVNLIAYNPSPDLPFAAPSPEAVLAFEKILWDKGMTAVLRKSKGSDISAACGQLRAAHLGKSDDPQQG